MESRASIRTAGQVKWIRCAKKFSELNAGTKLSILWAYEAASGVHKDSISDYIVQDGCIFSGKWRYR